MSSAAGIPGLQAGEDVNVRDILMNADAFKRAYPRWPHAEPPADLAVRLAAWLEAEGIASADSAPDLAGRIITAAGEDKTSLWLGDGTGSQVLRDAATGIVALAALGDAGLATENYWHGHGKRY
jgi:hypothetical protein